MSARDIRLGERNVRVTLTPAADEQLAREGGPLDIEMELYFSCLIRKHVHFLPGPHADCAARAPLSNGVSVSFRPVVGRPGALCDVSQAPVDGVTLAHPRAFTPRWLRLDYRAGRWQGEFGF